MEAEIFFRIVSLYVRYIGVKKKGGIFGVTFSFKASPHFTFKIYI